MGNGVLLRILVFTGVICMLFSTGAGAVSGTKPLTFYVSPKGNDAWSGRLAGPNHNRTDGPFATLVRARDAVRALKEEQGGLKQSVTVCLRSGVYRLTEPFVLRAEDSGTSECRVTYMRYRREKAVISGGRTIEGWRQVEVDGKKLWAADLPSVKSGEWYFRQLFANGRRLPRTRLPKEGFYRLAGLADAPADTPWNVGQDKAEFAGEDLKPWKNLEDVEVVALHFWVDSRLPISSVDPQSHVVTFGKKSVFRLTDDHGRNGARYFVENVFEALDTAGQWYLDRKEGKLYYFAKPSENPNDMTFTAPVLSQLVRLEGDAQKNEYVEYVSFDGLTFEHTEWMLPRDRSGSSQAAVSVPGAVLLDNSRNCAVRNCRIDQIGDYAVELTGSSADNEITGNDITDMGAGGVKVGHGTERTLAADNEIGDGGKIFHSAIGVWVGNSGHNKVVHNHIHDLYYTGISVGWTWGYGASNAVDNEIAYNHIHDVGRGWLSDLGGIYTLGVSPGTKLHHNLIHDSVAATYGGWGIYLDEGSTEIQVYDNVVYRTKTGGFHQHYGKNNLIQNNVFALNKEWQLQRTRQEPHRSFTFERNIVYFNEGSLLGSNWNDHHYRMDYNVYYDASGRPITFAGESLEDWRKNGMDVHSVIADPKFVDPLKGNFALKPDSPAFTLGFQPIDLSDVGPRRQKGY